MPITVKHTLYHFDELSDRAKETARDWWRNLEQMDFDPDYDDFIECAKRLGIEFDTRPVKLMGGGTRYDATVYWSGFSSQGDGACFEGRYSYVPKAQAAIEDYAPKDAELARIAGALDTLQHANGNSLGARMQHRGHYSHSGCMQVDVWCDEYMNATDDELTDAMSDGAEEELTELMRDFANWIYRQLETEYEWRMADEQVDDAITCNEYTFDESGHRAD